MNTIVVTRHPAFVELLRERGVVNGEVEVVAHATPDLVRGKRVVGFLPLHLAAEAAEVVVVDLALEAGDRGVELGIERLREIAGAVSTYKVERL